MLPELREDLTIYARKPWGPDSEVFLAPEPEEGGGLPGEAQTRGMEYLLEVLVAREFLNDWLESQDTDVPIERQCERLIQYAENDA